MYKLLKATYRARPNDIGLLDLDFEELGRIVVNFETKENFLAADLVPAIGYSGDLPVQSYTYPENEGGQTIELTRMIRNAEAARAAFRYLRSLDGAEELKDGEVLYQAK